MKTFEEYQRIAATVPLALRNNRDRIDLPVLGLQEEAAKIGSLLAQSFSPGRFVPTQAQNQQIKNELAEMLCYLALLCAETNIPLQSVADHSLVELQARLQKLDPDQR